MKFYFPIVRDSTLHGAYLGQTISEEFLLRIKNCRNYIECEKAIVRMEGVLNPYSIVGLDKYIRLSYKTFYGSIVYKRTSFSFNFNSDYKFTTKEVRYRSFDKYLEVSTMDIKDLPLLLCDKSKTVKWIIKERFQSPDEPLEEVYIQE